MIFYMFDLYLGISHDDDIIAATDMGETIKGVWSQWRIGPCLVNDLRGPSILAEKDLFHAHLFCSVFSVFLVIQNVAKRRNLNDESRDDEPEIDGTVDGDDDATNEEENS